MRLNSEGVVPLTGTTPCHNPYLPLEQHHKKMSFQDELRALLGKHDIEWDERYVWD